MPTSALKVIIVLWVHLTPKSVQRVHSATLLDWGLHPSVLCVQQENIVLSLD